MSSYNKIVSIFGLIRGSFFVKNFFCFCLYKIVDSENRMDIYKSVKISTGAVMQNPEMLKFVTDHLKKLRKCVNM